MSKFLKHSLYHDTQTQGLQKASEPGDDEGLFYLTLATVPDCLNISTAVKQIHKELFTPKQEHMFSLQILDTVICHSKCKAK